MRGSRREAGSNEIRPAPGIGGELVDSREIGLLKVGMLVENLLFSHPGTQPAEDIPDRDSESADARLSATLTRLDSDPADARCRHLKASLHISMPSVASPWEEREFRHQKIRNHNALASFYSSRPPIPSINAAAHAGISSAILSSRPLRISKTGLGSAPELSKTSP